MTCCTAAWATPKCRRICRRFIPSFQTGSRISFIVWLPLIRHVNGTARAGEHRRLLGVELTARNLESFSRSNPSIIDAVRLPTFEQSDRMAWPLPQIPLAAILAASMTPPHDPRFSADWGAAREKDVARRAAVEERWAKGEEQRQAESRRVYEASLRR